MRHLFLLTVALALVFGASAGAQESLLVPRTGTPIEEFAAARGAEVQPGWPERSLNPIEEAPPDAESFSYRLEVGSYPFDVTVFGFEGRIVAFQMELEAEAFSQRQGRAMVPPDCLVAFNGVSRLMAYALTTVDQPPARMPGASIGLTTITMPDGTQALVRGDFENGDCKVTAAYASKEMQALSY